MQLFVRNRVKETQSKKLFLYFPILRSLYSAWRGNFLQEIFILFYIFITLNKQVVFPLCIYLINVIGKSHFSHMTYF
jgi:hypothetical protein